MTVLWIIGLSALAVTPERLESLGYAMAQFGKNHLGDLDKYPPTAHGFDEFFGIHAWVWSTWPPTSGSRRPFGTAVARRGAETRRSRSSSYRGRSSKAAHTCAPTATASAAARRAPPPDDRYQHEPHRPPLLRASEPHVTATAMMAMLSLVFGVDLVETLRA